MEIDIIIPLYKPGKELFTLLDKLENQSVPVHKIILLNTEEKYFTALTYGTDFVKRYRNVEVFHLSKREFDHGGTRRLGVSRSTAPIFVMMTQDAVPADEFLLEKLTEPLKGNVAVSYARQLADSKSSVLERFSRQFNYPDKSCVKSYTDLERLGIKTYFCSNVCAAYRREIYDRQGGFVKRTIFNEDMLYAAKVIQAGHQIAYAAEAQGTSTRSSRCLQKLCRFLLEILFITGRILSSRDISISTSSSTRNPAREFGTSVTSFLQSLNIEHRSLSSARMSR